MNAETIQIFFALLFLLFLIYLITRVFLRPLRFLFKVALNSLFGLLLLWAFNFIGASFNFIIPLNWLTVLIAGFLGLPGMIVLIFFRLVLAG